MQFRLFMSQHKMNSTRNKSIGKKWFYLERYTFLRVQDISEGERH